MKISQIFLYDEPSVPEIQINDLARFIAETFVVPVHVRKSLFSHFKSDRETAVKLASSRVFNPQASFETHHPTNEEINFEEESFGNNSASDNIVLYDGFELQKIMLDKIPDKELSWDTFHLAFTTKLSCTYDPEDNRYHGRAVIGSNPSIISTTGIIEAPAKPRAYYLIMQHSISQGLNLDTLKDKFRGKFLEYHDKNLAQVVRGYALQAIF